MSDYRHEALCRDYDPEVFFPIDERRGTPSVERATAICAVCPVRVRCAEYALEHGIDYGIWGGLTSDERREVRQGARKVHSG